MNPLAPTTFSAGPKDTLATINVYDASGTSPVNSIQDTKTASTFDIGSILSNAGKGLLTGAGSLLKVSSTGSISLNAGTILKRLNTSIPQAAGALRGLSTTAQSSVTSSFTDYGNVNVNMGGVSSVVDSAHVTDLSGYGDYVNMVNAYGTGLTPISTDTGTCSIYDVDSHASLISAGVIQGSDYALPNSFTTLTTPTAVSSNLGLLNKVTTACLPILVKNGDLGNLKAMSATSGGQIFDAVLPNYGRLLTQGYSATTYGRNGGGGASVQDYQSIISIFTNTNSQWNVFDRIGDVVGQSPTLNLLKLIGGSKDFQTLLAVGVKDLVDGNAGKFNILAAMFPQTTVEAEVNRDFPKVILSTQLANSQTKKAQTIDPRVVNLIANTTRALIGNIPV